MPINDESPTASQFNTAKPLHEFVVRDEHEGVGLFHEPTGTFICDVEHGDTLDVLVRTAQSTMQAKEG